MPHPNKEQDSYSLDEMMERLKTKSSSKNPVQIVRDADGNEITTARKRKRRTKQTADTKAGVHKQQILYIVVFVIIAALFGISVGVGILYSNSVGFRNAVIKKFESASGAKLTLNQFRVNPLTTNVNSAELNWPKTSVMSRLVVNSVLARTSPTNIFSDIFRGDELIVRQAQLNLQNPHSEDISSMSTNSSSKVIFPNYLVHSLDLMFGESTNSLGSFTKSEVIVQPSVNDTSSTNIRLRGGILSAPRWPLLELDRGFMTLKDSMIFVQSLRFHVPLAQEKRHLQKGVIEFSGSFQPSHGNEFHQLETKLDNFDLKSILGPDLGTHICGLVDTIDKPNTNFLHIAPQKVESSYLKLAITNSLDSRIELARFPFLEFLKVSFDDDWYEFPNFDDNASFDLKRLGAEIEIRDIRLERRGRMSVRGSLIVDEAGGISGKWQIGIPQSRFSEIADKKLKTMFREVKSGYCWVELDLSGSQAQVSDNFRAIYDQTRPEANDTEISQPESSVDSFENLILEK